jgi:hypothetical protein
MPVIKRKTTEQPIVGKEYLYREAEGFYDHDPTVLHWVIVLGLDIVALRLREDYNPKIFERKGEVWVGADSPTCIWGSRLASDCKIVPLFVKKKGRRKYTYVGKYEVTGEDTSNVKLAAAAKTVPHERGISRIVFLQNN